MADPHRSRTPHPLDPPGVDPLDVSGGAWARRATLREGTRVLLRQIRPSDRARIAEGLAQLSPASRYLRFHATVERLSDTQLDVLTDVDHRDHDAVVALDRDHLDRPGVGVARFIREPYEPDVAEAAITVADAYHGLGAGTILLGALAARAREEGISVFRSYVLDGNTGMLEVFDHLGAQRQLETDGLWRVDLSVPDEDTDPPDAAAGRAFLELANEERRLASIFPPIWSRWRRDEQSGDRPEVDAELDELRRELDGWLAHRDQR